MAYAIRTKGGFFKVRDPSSLRGPAPGDPVYEVGPKDWVGFMNLPMGTSESGDRDLEVEAVELENGKWPDWVTRPKSEQEKRAEKLAATPAPTPQADPVVDAPRSRGGRRAKLSDNAKTEKQDGDE